MASTSMCSVAIQLLLVPLLATCQRIPGTDDTIKKLFTTIASHQELKDTAFSIYPVFSWENMKGMYKNDVKLNFHGTEQYSMIRELFHVPDNNMFTPAWVTSCLIEAYKYGRAPKPTDDQVLMALNLIDKFRDKNVPYNNSMMTFWPQTLNETANFYQSLPGNLLEVLSVPDYLPGRFLEEILDAIGLHDLAHVLEKIIREKDVFKLSFHIPPDFDDTFVNLGLGGLLSMFKGDFSSEHDVWMQQNTNLSSAFYSLKKYAYRPFSKSPKENSIDTRTYFYLRDFLDKAKTNGQDVAIVSTWIQDTEEVRVLFDKGVAMPFNVNNVDVTVSANFIYGTVMCIISSVCSNPSHLIDTDVEQIFLNTTSLLVHELNNNFSSRPDLALTYYTSQYEFYWFVSRTYALLNRFIIQHQVPAPTGRLHMMLLKAYGEIRPALRLAMTTAILTSTQTDKEGLMYIDNFLGDDDVGLLNESLKRAEDRLFSTSVSVAAMINTWTVWSNNSLIWESDVPVKVKTMVEKSVSWLTKYILTDDYRPWNTFFTGSGKGENSMPFFYPANRREYFNGTTFPDDKFPSDVKNIIGMEGFVSSAEYNNMLLRPHFGKMTPMTFDGYNSEKGGFFPFWSSDAYTYATTLVALSHYDNIRV